MPASDDAVSLPCPGAGAAAFSSRQRLLLAAILAVGFGLRMWYLGMATSTPGFSWDDPDGYRTHAELLAHGPDGWRWTFDAVRYSLNGRDHALPPLYSVFLSLFAVWPGFPFTALVAQAVLGTLAITLIFDLGRSIHSAAAGLIAAAGFALWVPNIFNVWSTSQEALYLPLILLGFALLARAMIADAGPLRHAAAGAVFGLAALTRSMPLFFVVPAAGLFTALASDRRRGARQAAAFLAAFALMTVPYSLALSREMGQLTLIDTHGSIHFPVTEASGARAPGLRETASALWESIAADPIAYMSASADRARTLLYVNGGRILQIYVVAGSKAAAMAWKVVVHLGVDALLIVSATLALAGAILCRHGRVAAILLLWAGLNIAVASVGGFGGARLRAPFEPLLLVLGAVVPAGGWRRRPVTWIAAGVALAALCSAVVLPQLPNSLRARADYGVEWPSVLARPAGRLVGTAGFNLPVYEGMTTFAVTPPAGGPAGPHHVQLDVRLGGVPIDTVLIAAGEERTLTYVWPRRGLAFVELTAVDPASGRPAEIRITRLEPR
jgi:hypothetical protein